VRQYIFYLLQYQKGKKEKNQHLSAQPQSIFKLRQNLEIKEGIKYIDEDFEKAIKMKKPA